MRSPAWWAPFRSRRRRPVGWACSARSAAVALAANLAWSVRTLAVANDTHVPAEARRLRVLGALGRATAPGRVLSRTSAGSP
eukprot:11996786-Alexandrium_andersonii.AAC.1